MQPAAPASRASAGCLPRPHPHSRVHLSISEFTRHAWICFEPTPGLTQFILTSVISGRDLGPAVSWERRFNLCVYEFPPIPHPAQLPFLRGRAWKVLGVPSLTAPVGAAESPVMLTFTGVPGSDLGSRKDSRVSGRMARGPPPASQGDARGSESKPPSPLGKLSSS